MRRDRALALKNYQLLDILPASGALASTNADQGDILVDLAASEGWNGKVIATKGDFQFELLPDSSGSVLVRHASDGLVGIYFDNSLGVRSAWAGKGLGVALILYGYDNGKTPSASRQFTTAGAKTMTNAMSVATGNSRNSFWP
jgi:GNAT superfamily N-acetyltransferase